MVIELVAFSIFCLNALPPKNGIMQHYSPTIIITSTILDVKKHGKLLLGAYAETHKASNPSNGDVFGLPEIFRVPKNF